MPCVPLLAPVIRYVMVCAIVVLKLVLFEQSLAKPSVGESFKDLVFINLMIAGKIESLKALT